MGWTWYLGNDMIFFLVSIILLPLYYRSKLAGWLSVFVLTGISVGVTVYYVLDNHLSVKFDDYHYDDYSRIAYSNPVCRIPAYFVGIVTAWIVEEMEKRGFTRQSRPTGTGAQVTATILAILS